MTMRCVRCNRELLAASVSIRTRSGTRVFGPKCARLAGLVLPQRQRTTKPRASAIAADANQLTLALEVIA